jgi:hypothetical protein
VASVSRQVMRVPLNFGWPLNEKWIGYESPPQLDEAPCQWCESTGFSQAARALQDLWYGKIPFDPASTGSTPFQPEHPIIQERAAAAIRRAPDFYGTGMFAVAREAVRLAEHFNRAWCYHLAQDDVEALLAADRLWDFTRVWSREHRWQRALGAGPTPVAAADVNAWSISSLGHDSINCWVVVKARCQAAGVPATCAVCAGHGSHETYPGQREQAEQWKREDPPAGDGWQLWKTVSEGSPISPVFPTAEDLATWMSDPDRAGRTRPPTSSS